MAIPHPATRVHLLTLTALCPSLVSGERGTGAAQKGNSYTLKLSQFAPSLPIRPINFPFPEFQAVRRVKHLTLVAVGYPLVPLTGMSADAEFPRRRHS